MCSCRCRCRLSQLLQPSGLAWHGMLLVLAATIPTLRLGGAGARRAHPISGQPKRSASAPPAVNFWGARSSASFRASVAGAIVCTAKFLCQRRTTAMASMRRDDVIWTLAITSIAITINPLLKSIGLLPADVFRTLGIAFPGQPQIVFGPLMALLLIMLFLKTAKAMVFPVIGTLRALSLSFVFPANIEHSGTLLAAIVAGVAAVMVLNNPQWAQSRTWLSLLGGLYAGLY